MPDYHNNPDPIQRVVDYLRDNDHHEDGAEGEMADELAGLRSQLVEAVKSADMALHDAARFTGQMAELDLDPEAVNAPFNDGGSGYEAHKKLWALRERLH